MPRGKPSQALREARKRIEELESALASPSSATAPPPTESAAVPQETASASSAVDGDPFADVPRDQATQPAPESAPRVTAEQTGDDEGPTPPAGATRLGEAGARAYLPLLFGMADTLSCAGASWLLRRKLGAQGARAFEAQAHEIARLSEAERLALEGALVAKLAEVELTPDEALFLTVLGIYAAKAVAVQALAHGGAPPLLEAA